MMIGMKLKKRMDIIGQNGNDGLHYEKSNQQKTGKTIIKS